MDTTELLLVIQMCLHQVWTGSEADATTMASLMDTGQLTPPVEAATDARSVFDSLAATDVGTLQEGSLVLHLLSLRDRLCVGTLSKAWWSDTRDMLADGLTKGPCHDNNLWNVVIWAYTEWSTQRRRQRAAMDDKRRQHMHEVPHFGSP